MSDKNLTKKQEMNLKAIKKGYTVSIYRKVKYLPKEISIFFKEQKLTSFEKFYIKQTLYEHLLESFLY